MVAKPCRILAGMMGFLHSIIGLTNVDLEHGNLLMILSAALGYFLLFCTDSKSKDNFIF